MRNVAQESVDKITRETTKRLESLFQEYRNLCVNDEDFSRRTLAITDNDSGITQYCFDGEYIFYTKYEYDLYTISIKFYSGMLPGFLGSEVVNLFYGNSKDQTE